MKIRLSEINNLTVNGSTYNSKDIRYNPSGVFLTRDGEVFKAENGPELIDFSKKIFPILSKDGYFFIPDTEMRPKVPSGIIIDSQGNHINGKYLHRMMVFSFGDCNGRVYSSTGVRSVIDHVSMNRTNNSIDNLQLVSFGINLFRAYYKTKNKECEERFKEYYRNLDEIDRKILDIEIGLDIEGKY